MGLQLWIYRLHLVKAYPDKRILFRIRFIGDSNRSLAPIVILYHPETKSGILTTNRKHRKANEELKANRSTGSVKGDNEYVDGTMINAVHGDSCRYQSEVTRKGA